MTEQDHLYTAGCIQGGRPPCSCGCPLNFDIKKFITRIRANNFQTAYRDLANRVVFPGIVCHICDQRCMKDCPASLSMKALELACVSHVRNRDARTYALPEKKQRVAIVGAGVAGMACAQKLATKKYDVTVYERGNQAGGNLLQILETSLIHEEFEHQFHNLPCDFRLNQEILSLDSLDQDAIFIGTGAGGVDFGLRDGWNAQSMATVKEGVFLGGMLTRDHRMDALADGIMAAISIEQYLTVASMSGRHENFYVHECTLPPAAKQAHGIPVAAAGDIYTREEGVREAARCLLCDCTRCYDACQFMQSFRSFPKRVEVEAMNSRVTEQNLVDRVGTRLIASCALCGHCEAVCDRDVNMEKLMRESKQHLFRAGSFPPAWHDFYLRDMAESMGESWLVQTAPALTAPAICSSPVASPWNRTRIRWKPSTATCWTAFPTRRS